MDAISVHTAFQNFLVADAVLWQVNPSDHITPYGFFNRPPFLLGIRISVDQEWFRDWNAQATGISAKGPCRAGKDASPGCVSRDADAHFPGTSGQFSRPC